MIYNSYSILLTATVNPGGMVYTKRSDPSLRLRDYEESLELWFRSRLGLPFVFCENSAFDLGRMQEIPGNDDERVEFLSFNGQGFPKEAGKGYGEVGILSHAVNNSSCLKHSKYVVKVTGRYYVKNISKIIKAIELDKGVDIYCDLAKNLSYSDSRFFIASVDFLKEYLCPIRSTINDSSGVFFEHALARAAHRAMSDGRIWSPLPYLPDIVGVSGTSNTVYKRTYIRRLKRNVCNSVKRLAFATC